MSILRCTNYKILSRRYHNLLLKFKFKKKKRDNILSTKFDNIGQSAPIISSQNYKTFKWVIRNVKFNVYIIMLNVC